MSEGWIKTTCAYCGVGCGIEARPTIKGTLEVKGDQSHPSNYGKLCIKGASLGDTVTHEGRLLTPKTRSGEQWSDTDWPDAITTVADRFRQTIEEYGPDSVAFYVSGQLLTEDYYVANKLIKGFIGTANIDSNSRLCMASSVVGHKRAFGMDSVPVCYEDLEQTDLVLLVGSNLAWCHPVLSQRLNIAKQNNPNLKVVVIDPRRNESCEIADMHMAINPGSDVSLFNGLLSYLSEHGHLDVEFIRQHTNGFNKAFDMAKEESRDVASVTGVELDQLEEFYRLFAETDRTITIYSQGVNQSSHGSDKVNSIINCHLATGRIGKEGAGPFSVTGQPNAMGGREVGALANTLAAHMEFGNDDDIRLIENFWQTGTLARKPGLKAVDMFDAVYEGKIKAIWIMATNPMVSLPDTTKIRKALEKCPFVVVSDCIENTATTPFADVLFPAQGWSEKSGTVTNSERRISRQRRLLPSPGLARPDWWIISRVAQKMGFGTQFNYLHEGEVFNEYARMTTLGNDCDQRDLNLQGLTNLTDTEYQYLKPQQWPVMDYQEEIKNRRLFQDGLFYTGDRKANFIAVKHCAPVAKVSKEYPLVLNTGRTKDHWHTMTRTGLSPRLGQENPEPYVLIHPATAENFNLRDNDLAKVSNNHGVCLARVIESDGMRKNEIFIPIHWNDITASKSKVCALIDARTDASSGQPEFKYTPATIEPCHYQSRGLVFVRHPVVLDNVVDYWSRQRIENGYLYRVEGNFEHEALIQHMKSLFNSGISKEFVLQSTETYSLVKSGTESADMMIYLGSYNEALAERLINEFADTNREDDFIHLLS